MLPDARLRLVGIRVTVSSACPQPPLLKPERSSRGWAPEELTMASYLERFDATPEAKRWPLVRGWMFSEPLLFYAELREKRPILVMPELTLATRFNDCTEVLRRHELFSVALYKPKEGDYWMDQDDTAVHWREKSIMRAILDFEELPAIRNYVGKKAASLLAAAGGQIDAV